MLQVNPCPSHVQTTNNTMQISMQVNIQFLIGMGRVKTRPEAVWSNPTRTIFQRTQATRGNILFDPSNPNFLKKFYSQTIKCK